MRIIIEYSCEWEESNRIEWIEMSTMVGWQPIHRQRYMRNSVPVNNQLSSDRHSLMYASQAPTERTDNAPLCQSTPSTFRCRGELLLMVWKWNGMVLAKINSLEYLPLFDYYLFVKYAATTCVCWWFFLLLLLFHLLRSFGFTVCMCVDDKINCSIVAVHIRSHTHKHA